MDDLDFAAGDPFHGDGGKQDSETFATPKQPSESITITSSSIFTDSGVETCLSAISFGSNDFVGVAFLFTERNALELYQFTDTPTYIHTLSLIELLHPSDVLIPTSPERDGRQISFAHSLTALDLSLTTLQRQQFRDPDIGRHVIDDAGLRDIPHAASAAHALLRYCEAARGTVIAPHSLAVDIRPLFGRLMMDGGTVNAVHLLSVPGRPGLIDLIPTRTPGGRRALLRSFLQPFTDPPTLSQRYDAVLEMVAVRDLHYALQAALPAVKAIGGGTRLISVTTGNLGATLSGLLELQEAIHALPALAAALTPAESTLTTSVASHLAGAAIPSLAPLAAALDAGLTPDMPSRTGPLVALMRGTFALRGGSEGVLDAARVVLTEVIDDIEAHRAAVTDQTGAPLTLKYTAALGFHFILPKTHPTHTPPLTRLPGRAAARAATTDTLGRLNNRVRSAAREIMAAGLHAAEGLVAAVREALPALASASDVVALLDVLVGFATFSATHQCVAPTLAAASPSPTVLTARGLRCSLLQAPVGQDVAIDAGTIVWGPHGAGKSVLLRALGQALVLAHVGCPVPATRFTFRPIDALAARIGAGDDSSATVSSFTAECGAAATLIHRAAAAPGRSITLLDEFGRGTSVGDGAALAWAVTERLVALEACPVLVTHQPALRGLAALPGVDPLTVASSHIVGRGAPTEVAWGLECAEIEALPPALLRRAADALEAVRAAAQPVATEEMARHELARRLRAVCRSSLDGATLRAWLAELKAKALK